MSNPSPLKRGPTLEPPAGKSSGVLSYGSFTYGYKVSGIGHWVSHGCLLFLHPKLDPPLPLYAFTFTFAHGGGGDSTNRAKGWKNTAQTLQLVTSSTSILTRNCRIDNRQYSQLN